MSPRQFALAAIRPPRRLGAPHGAGRSDFFHASGRAQTPAALNAANMVHASGMDLLYCGSWCHSRETPIATKMATAQATRVSKMKITKQSMSCINAFSSCRPLTVCEVRYGYRLLVQNLQPAQSDDHDFRGHEPTSKSDPYLSLTGRSFDVRQHPCLVEERLFWTVEACEPPEASVGIGGYPI